jgi:hypothetical protein
MVVLAAGLSMAVYIGVRQGRMGQLKRMDQVCGVVCFPHDVVYPKVKGVLGLGEGPTVFSLSLWSIIGGFFIIAIYFSVLFLPLFLYSRGRKRRIWLILQGVLLLGHLYLYYRVTFPTI